MLGNLAGFVAPVVGGVVPNGLVATGTLLIYTMAAAATISALCWLFLGSGIWTATTGTWSGRQRAVITQEVTG